MAVLEGDLGEGWVVVLKQVDHADIDVTWTDLFA